MSKIPVLSSEEILDFLKGQMRARGLSVYILDDAGNPVASEDMLEYGRFLCCDPRRRIAEEEVNGVFISTVFVGDRFPMMWETLCDGDIEATRLQMRYASRAEAEAGHKLMVERIRSATNRPKRRRRHD